MKFLGSVKMGGMYLDNVSQKIPQRPYSTEKEIFNGSGLGDLPSYDLGSSWSFGDTPTDEEKKIKWHNFKIGDKTLYVCDRVLINKISKEDIDRVFCSDYVYIDNKKYIPRILTEDEWATLVINENKIEGLVSYYKTSSRINKDVRNSNHNLFWNWIGIYNHVESEKGCFCYGYFNVHEGKEVIETSKGEDMGFRPVLEEVSIKPIINGEEGRLGEFENSFIYQYSTLSHLDNDLMQIEEKINDTVIRSYSVNGQLNQSSIDLANYWDELSIGIHTITVKAVNKEGEVSVKKAQFNTPVSTFVNKEGLDYFASKIWNEKIKPFVTEVSKRQGGLVLDSSENFTGVGVKENTNLADNGVCIKAQVDSTSKVLACFSTNAIKLGNHGLIVRVVTDTIVSGNSFSIAVYKKSGNIRTELIKTNVNCSSFLEANKYQNFYTMFEYNGQKQDGDVVEVEILTASNGNIHNISLDYILISQMLPAVFL